MAEALKAAGLYDDTAVFMFSAHGDVTGDYGLVEKNQNTFEDCLTRVPLVIKPPAWVPVVPGVRDALVELIDFPATVEDLTGIEPRHTHFGRSLLPLVRDETDEHRDAVFSEGAYKSGLWQEVGPGRMKARGLDEDGLHEYYRNRNLLKARVTARHVANAALFFVTRQTPTTGGTIPVDGGLPDATPR